MKIVHAIFSFFTGGTETLLVDIINQQCREASVSLIVVNDKVNPALLEAIDKRVDIFLLKRKESAKTQLIKPFFQIRKIVNQINPDIIHCHDNTLFPFFFLQRKKTCLTVHATFLPDLFLKNYRKVFAVSAAVQHQIKQRTGICSGLIYNGILIDEYQTRRYYDFNPRNEVWNIVQISRLDPLVKGQCIAIQSIARIKEKYPNRNIRLTFVGAGETLEELKALAAEYKVSDCVVFLGQKDRSWIQEHLKDFHLLIQPSLYEGFGLTVVEGFAAGIPVIASNIDGPKEILNLLNAGISVQPNDPIDLAEKIDRIYQSYVSNALKESHYILQNKNQMKMFDIQTTAKAYLDNYSLIILK